MATHSSILAWRIPGMRRPGGLPSMGSHRVGYGWSDLAAAAAACSMCASQVAPVVKNLPAKRRKRWRFNPGVGRIPWRRTWQPTPVFLLEECHGQRSLVGYRPWGRRVRHDWSDLAPWSMCHLSSLTHSSNPCLLQSKCGVLTTVPPGKSWGCLWFWLSKLSTQFLFKLW